MVLELNTNKLLWSLSLPCGSWWSVSFKACVLYCWMTLTQTHLLENDCQSTGNTCLFCFSSLAERRHATKVWREAEVPNQWWGSVKVTYQLVVGKILNIRYTRCFCYMKYSNWLYCGHGVQIFYMNGPTCLYYRDWLLSFLSWCALTADGSFPRPSKNSPGCMCISVLGGAEREEPEGLKSVAPAQVVSVHKTSRATPDLVGHLGEIMCDIRLRIMSEFGAAKLSPSVTIW